MKEENLEIAGKTGGLLFQPITAFPGNGSRPGRKSMDGIEPEENGLLFIGLVHDSVMVSKKAAVSSHCRGREHPFPYGSNADLPVSRNRDERNFQGFEEIEGHSELPNSASVGDIPGHDHKIEALGDKIPFQCFEFHSGDVLANMQI
jgi:hypothetical protein